MQLEFLRKMEYGNERFYPLNDDAKFVAQLMEQKSLTKDNVKACVDHGWEVIVKLPDYKIE